TIAPAGRETASSFVTGESGWWKRRSAWIRGRDDMVSAAKVGGGAGLLVALGMLISSLLGVGVFGPGGGENGGDEPSQTAAPVDSPEVQKETKPTDGQIPATLTVRIVGSEYRVDDEPMTAAEIAALAASRTDADGKTAPATIKIVRAEDATRGAREAL